MFEWWHRVRDGTLARSTFRRYMRPVQARVADMLEEGCRSSCAKTQRTCLRLLQNSHALWTFVYNTGIEPTNNIGERAIRRAVIIRKTSFGSQSEHGCRFLERVLTVHATLRQRGRICPRLHRRRLRRPHARTQDRRRCSRPDSRSRGP